LASWGCENLPLGKLLVAESRPLRQLENEVIGSACGILPKPPFRLPRLEAEAERQTTKEPEKMSARTLFWPEAGFLNFY